jgi:hypothetical protein
MEQKKVKILDKKTLKVATYFIGSKGFQFDSLKFLNFVIFSLYLSMFFGEAVIATSLISNSFIDRKIILELMSNKF